MCTRMWGCVATKILWDEHRRWSPKGAPNNLSPNPEHRTESPPPRNLFLA